MTESKPKKAMQFYPTDSQYEELMALKGRLEKLSFLPGETRVTWSSYLRGLVDNGIEVTKKKIEAAEKAIG